MEEVEPCYQYENQNDQNRQYAQNARNEECQECDKNQKESGKVTKYAACKDGFLRCLRPLWNVLSISGSNGCNSLGFALVMHQKTLILVILA